MKNSSLILVAFGLILFACKKDVPKPKPGPIVYDVPVTDIDGNTYQTVKIGEQVWMAENLRVTKLNNGTLIPFVTADQTWSDPGITEPMMCYYENAAANLTKYGMLYNGYAVATGKLAPTDWHVATDADWQKLQNFLISHGYNYDGSYSGNKIAKAIASTTDWIAQSTEGGPGNDPEKNNTSGFNALPGGDRSPNYSYVDKGLGIIWWSVNANEVSIRYIITDTPNLIASNSSNPKAGCYVRCVKDVPIN